MCLWAQNYFTIIEEKGSYASAIAYSWTISSYVKFATSGLTYLIIFDVCDENIS